MRVMSPSDALGELVASLAPRGVCLAIAGFWIAFDKGGDALGIEARTDFARGAIGFPGSDAGGLTAGELVGCEAFVGVSFGTRTACVGLGTDAARGFVTLVTPRGGCFLFEADNGGAALTTGCCMAFGADNLAVWELFAVGTASTRSDGPLLPTLECDCEGTDDFLTVFDRLDTDGEALSLDFTVGEGFTADKELVFETSDLATSEVFVSFNADIDVLLEVEGICFDAWGFGFTLVDLSKGDDTFALGVVEEADAFAAEATSCELLFAKGFKFDFVALAMV